MNRSLRCSLAILALLRFGGMARGEPSDVVAAVRPTLERYCLGCHSAKSPKGGIDLSGLTDEHEGPLDIELWGRVAEAMSEQTMPPAGKEGPDEAERDRIIRAVEQSLEASEGVRDPGRRTIQRLTRVQYSNTIRDLLGVDTNVSDGFPVDGAGGGGFDNNGSTLFVSPILMEKYLDAADTLLARADPSRYLASRPSIEVSKESAARSCLEDFATRAYRRPVSVEDMARLMRLFRRADELNRPFGESIRLVLRAVLASPNFLFLVERDREGTGPHRVDDHELACRLSYFLWSSMPDDTLRGLADQGRLHEPEVLDAQVRRMIDDPRSRELAKDFASQWLGVRALTSPNGTDRSRFSEYTPGLREAMVEEVISSFDAVLRDDAPVLDLIEANYIHVNEILARHYGISGVVGPDFRKVGIEDRRRGGVLGMAAVLTLTSYAERTSPVLRGRWILAELLGTPPPPPPPNVKVLPLEDKPIDGMTFRQRLERHRAQEACASCHSKLDPPGFALEGFDPLGRIRSSIGGSPVDDSGKLPSGESFRGAIELKKVLRERKKELFLRNLTRRMLSYALARGLEPFDAPTVKEIIAKLEERDYRSRTLVTEIVRSFPFQYRRNEPIVGGPAK
ncbi:DUF1592 domain-containing protein [Singulisphaera sp. PoT]|uniref:DUF1592 domain-containing protein n=1 Tax=Singulisphaera sp. PoT TaxID=3411797 RepID=UPI003BF472D0